MYQCNTKVIKQLFTQDECDRIMGVVGQQEAPQPALTSGKLDRMTRNCELVWLEYQPEIDWVFKRLWNCFEEANREYYDFNLTEVERLQYLKYERFNFFTPHFDIGAPGIGNRKLAISIQLSHSHEYWGGNLSVRDISGWVNAPRDRGDAIIFPTYLLHQAHMIYHGTRHCMIAWARGERPFQ